MKQGHPGLGIAVRKAVVDVLVVAGFADDKSIRTLMVSELREALDHPFTFSDQLTGRDQLIEIVSACCRLAEGLNALADVIEFLRPGSKECAEVRTLVTSVRMHEVVPEAEQEKLRERLAGFAPPGLGMAVRRAARYVSPPPRFEDASAAFSGLADFNAGPGELPPLLIFVELIAAECDDELAAELRGWSDGQVRRLRLGDALAQLRAELAAARPAPGTLHLMIVVRPDPIEDDLYELSCWRQEDPDDWSLSRGEAALVRESELERRVDVLIAETEQAWSEVVSDVVVEFVLPRALLNLPVHSWATERASGAPKPLYLSYQTVVRSLERMSAPRWHRVWRQRWESWVSDPSFERVYFCRAGDRRDPLRLEAILSHEQWAMTVLTESPPVSAISGQDELLPALRTGVPVIVWHPSAPSEVVREVVALLAESSGGLGDLPALVRESRLDALRNPPSSGDGGALTDLVVLWDDPNRLLPIGETGIVVHPEGGADQRDRAS
ncbi:effector-associated domain 2-containing protein [Amycolatopsis kentuckyensis]|uniref:VMAP-C domain-containing protein n=1 Tax=Amycolatopsis kentuckyensis TaxID=218823 RepID=UPI001FC8FE54|nr:hypothetical protein [Amycolatopsis kentuckyensis]